MSGVSIEIKGNTFLPPSEQPWYFLPRPPREESNLNSSDLSMASKISPGLLLVILLLSIIFFVSGLLHLLVKFLLIRRSNRDEDELENTTDFQGQLQQLFHLHDSGVDQSFIDTLPVFHYKTIIGLKNPFDCAICLCEFEGEDKLRLLPKCSHAFHMECIDTWLLSHSTCPLCRASLIPEDCHPPNNPCSPIVLVLESRSESSREANIASDRVNNSASGANSLPGLCLDTESASSASLINLPQMSPEINTRYDSDQSEEAGDATAAATENVVPVKLGKLRNIDVGEGPSTSSSKIDSRRCYSMGSFEYVMDENCSLQVPILADGRKQSSLGFSFPLAPTHRPAMSDYEVDSESRTGLCRFKTNPGTSKQICRNQRECFSVSKIWIKGKKETKSNAAEVSSSSRQAVSLRFPDSRNAADNGNDKGKNRNHGGNESWWDGENQSYRSNTDSSELQEKTPSFTRRSLFWLVGKQNKVIHSSSTPDA